MSSKPEHSHFGYDNSYLIGESFVDSDNEEDEDEENTFITVRSITTDKVLCDDGEVWDLEYIKTKIPKPLIMIKIKVTTFGGKVGLSRSSEINAKPNIIVNMRANKLLNEPQSS